VELARGVARDEHGVVVAQREACDAEGVAVEGVDRENDGISMALERRDRVLEVPHVDTTNRVGAIEKTLLVAQRAGCDEQTICSRTGSSLVLLVRALERGDSLLQRVLGKVSER
jgi:hypothetical protein